ncbi:hypothetical protein [Halalkalibacterium halodurans]|uniref:BH4020 protein n=1 Tax=Halalkalibacterium halodurans (strain ATCC BAA-125 / DSM 18197 / FERM 7344 / JCM 9153 / C-125) TaxID=272558 RepID=Q9K5R8_HALH5|nr:hypothetical protein [Halalkalibacterium halodurans]MDY7224536.1 hypothetical protein [Halalkalibacterium halodurans]MDY7243821.1 hypothetical protein [Halalkalibacterium halodurans]MED4174892.1 hypothetical protein [Halalkalibacterium halodurans]BAB07739.1 BH4020 [Halalkalibacterium halodurans C-125]
MKRSTKKWLITILLVIVGSIFGVSLYNEKKSSEQQVEISWGRVDSIADEFWFDVKYSSTNSNDVEFFPTEDTERMLERWKAVTELYPEAGYPDEVIKRGDWLEVSRIFREIAFHEIQQEMIEDTDALPEGERISESSLEDYIIHRNLYSLGPVLVELGLEEEDH